MSYFYRTEVNQLAQNLGLTVEETYDKNNNDIFTCTLSLRNYDDELKYRVRSDPTRGKKNSKENACMKLYQMLTQNKEKEEQNTFKKYTPSDPFFLNYKQSQPTPPQPPPTTQELSSSSSRQENLIYFTLGPILSELNETVENLKQATQRLKQSIEKI